MELSRQHKLYQLERERKLLLLLFFSIDKQKGKQTLRRRSSCRFFTIKYFQTNTIAFFITFENESFVPKTSTK